MEFISQEIKEKKIVILKIPEKLDAENSEELNNLIRNKVNEGYYRLVIDMMDTIYVDSTGLGAIVSRIALVRTNQGDIRLAIESDFVKELLQVTNLNKILKCFDTVEDTVKSFS